MTQSTLIASSVLLLIFLPATLLATDGGSAAAVAAAPAAVGATSNGAGSAGVLGSGDLNAGFLGSFANVIPALRNFPAFSFLPNSRGAATGDPGLDMAIAEFSEPIVRFAAGEKPVPADIRQMVGSLPDLILNIPGVGDVDITKLPPPLIAHILRGGQIFGVPRSSLDSVVRSYTQKMYDAALRARAGTPWPGDEKYLPPLRSLPEEVITTFMSGKRIPYLDQNQIKTIQEYYTSQIPVELGGGTNSSGNGTQFNPQMFSMLSLLPPNYNFSKIPPAVVKQVINGEMPDFSLLPQDIIDYLRANSDKMFDKFKISPNTSLEEILQKLPRFDPVQHDVTFTPYDVNKVDADLVLKEQGMLSSSQVKILTGVAIAVFALVTIVILGFFAYYLRMDRAEKVENTSIGL